jgi:hypothetical protein
VPYRVYYDPLVSRKGMRQFCARNGLAVTAEYGDGFSRLGKGLMGRAISLLLKAVSLISLGTLSARHLNLIYILSKQSTNARSAESGGQSLLSATV